MNPFRRPRTASVVDPSAGLPIAPPDFSGATHQPDAPEAWETKPMNRLQRCAVLAFAALAAWSVVWAVASDRGPAGGLAENFVWGGIALASAAAAALVALVPDRTRRRPRHQDPDALRRDELFRAVLNDTTEPEWALTAPARASAGLRTIAQQIEVAYNSVRPSYSPAERQVIDRAMVDVLLELRRKD